MNPAPINGKIVEQHGDKDTNKESAPERQRYTIAVPHPTHRPFEHGGAVKRRKEWRVGLSFCTFKRQWWDGKGKGGE